MTRQQPADSKVLKLGRWVIFYFFAHLAWAFSSLWLRHKEENDMPKEIKKAIFQEGHAIFVSSKKEQKESIKFLE